MLLSIVWTVTGHSFNIYTCFIQAAEQDYEREKLNERIAKLSGGVAVIQVKKIIPFSVS